MELCEHMSAKALLNVHGYIDSEHIGEINCLISGKAFIYPRVGHTAGFYMTYLGKCSTMSKK
jgi:hypothetical protein